MISISHWGLIVVENCSSSQEWVADPLLDFGIEVQ